ncbi:hypothetical protein DFP72DRAFT_1081875 [Ephemerocybe angulata]|uniref:Uncharacterized protein n=1 Tax=Ephemerocybe angulata TaxID=980116 RepID=A0A8H6H9N7_9AGAR|nr:hypothetical protein DFP72DRAFT_1081875 [Tulosesus angulatus]
MPFDSLVKSNPKHGPGWNAAARLEEHAGRMVAAKEIIKKGLHNNDDAKVILAIAVQHAKKRVFRKALDHIPTSVRLLRETVGLELSPSDYGSFSHERSLALLETPEKAKAVFNKESEEDEKKREKMLLAMDKANPTIKIPNARQNLD